jgi:hypothetical protein
MHGEIENLYKTTVGTPNENRRFGRPVCTEKGNIKTDLKEKVYQRVDWIAPMHDTDP